MRGVGGRTPLVGECPEGARNGGADDDEGAEARGAFPRLLVVERSSRGSVVRGRRRVRGGSVKDVPQGPKVPGGVCFVEPE